MALPAAQASVPATTAPTPTPAPAQSPVSPMPAAPSPSPVAGPPIAVQPDGSISGVDGMLNQIAGALTRQAMPLVKNELLPILQNDKAMQAHIGRSIGREIAKPLWVMAAVAGVYVGWKIYDGRHGPRANPSRKGR